jgi:hypothetical protein
MGGASIKYYYHVTFAAHQGSNMFAEQGGRSTSHADVPGVTDMGRRGWSNRSRRPRWNILEGVTTISDESRRLIHRVAW